MKRKILYLIGLLFMSFAVVCNVHAVELVKAGETVIQDGEYDSSRIVAGNNVTNEAKVDGISIVAGNNIIANGAAPYGVYAGNSITIKENIEKDLFAAGNSIAIESEAVIGRDAFIAGSTITIKTNIPRDLRVAGKSVDLRGVTVGGDAYLYTDTIVLDEKTVITGKLAYVENANVKGLDGASVGSVEVKKYEVETNRRFFDRALEFIASAVAAFVTMVILFFVMPKLKKRLDEVELGVEKIAASCGIGVLLLIVVPIAAIIAMFTTVLMPVSLITIVLYVIALYIAQLLTCYIVGKVITEKAFKIENQYLALGVGILLIRLIKLIPIVGGIISAIALLYGLGLIFNFIKTRDN